MILGGIALAISLFVGIFVYLIPALQQGNSDEPKTPIELTIWGIEDSKNFSDVFLEYTKAHPNITFDYREISEERYEKTLLEALATDQGPDIFMIHRSWASRYDNKIVSAAQDRISPSEVTTLFPSVVGRDFVRNGSVSALPFYIDTLALLYNKALFDKKGVAVTPKTWGDIKTLIPYFTEFTPGKQLKKSAIALGGSSQSITNAPDILSLFMFQFGAINIEDSERDISFYGKAVEAADSYTQFSKPGDTYHTWDDSFANADNAFGSGDTAMMLVYSRDIPSLVRKNPYLDFGIVPAPQQNASDPVNYADYWGLTASLKSVNSDFAWKFITETTTDPLLAARYTEQSGNPPALRELISNVQRDARLGIFAKQSLTAHAAFQYESSGYRAALSRAIEDINSGKFTVESALNKAASTINNLF